MGGWQYLTGTQVVVGSQEAYSLVTLVLREVVVALNQSEVEVLLHWQVVEVEEEE